MHLFYPCKLQPRHICSERRLNTLTRIFTSPATAAPPPSGPVIHLLHILIVSSIVNYNLYIIIIVNAPKWIILLCLYSRCSNIGIRRVRRMARKSIRVPRHIIRYTARITVGGSHTVQYYSLWTPRCKSVITTRKHSIVTCIV